MTRVHHSAIVVRDVEASLRFWRDGIGFEVIMDHEFEGDWPALFDASGTRLRSVFLGDPTRPDSGIVELVQLAGPPAGRPGPAPAAPPAPGFFLLSVYVEVDTVLGRLADLGLADLGGVGPRRISVPAPGGVEVAMATVHDPDGVLVELIGA